MTALVARRRWKHAHCDVAADGSRFAVCVGFAIHVVIHLLPRSGQAEPRSAPDRVRSRPIGSVSSLGRARPRSARRRATRRAAPGLLRLNRPRAGAPEPWRLAGAVPPAPRWHSACACGSRERRETEERGRARGGRHGARIVVEDIARIGAGGEARRARREAVARTAVGGGAPARRRAGRPQRPHPLGGLEAVADGVLRAPGRLRDRVRCGESDSRTPWGRALSRHVLEGSPGSRSAGRGLRRTRPPPAQVEESSGLYRFLPSVGGSFYRPGHTRGRASCHRRCRRPTSEPSSRISRESAENQPTRRRRAFAS